MKLQKYLHYKLEIITDVFGERCYVYEELYDKNFKIKIHKGRPVGMVYGGNRFIVTAELKAFILSTLDVPDKEFNDLLKPNLRSRLRRLLQDNPFKSYEDWLNSKQANKPHFITFNDAPENPQILIGALGQRYVLLSALRTDKFILPMGVLEVDYLDKKKATSSRAILTHEVAKHLKEINFDKNKKNAAISDTVFYAFCAELGHSTNKVHEDREALFVQHLDELLNLKTRAFILKYPELNISQKSVARFKFYISLVLKEVQNPSSVLIPALLKHWEQPNDETSKKVDVVFGRKSSRVRRAFLLLKKAKRI